MKLLLWARYSGGLAGQGSVRDFGSLGGRTLGVMQTSYLPYSPRSDGAMRWGQSDGWRGDPESRTSLQNRKGQSCVFTEGKGLEEASSPFLHLPSPVYSFLVPSRDLSHS